ncbi:MAG: phosphoribosylanthranilate isomerase [Thermoleophilia bacterium]|nr:phosphoribosylanthranilate isomerase [Thermoleophilia bacterium]
MPDAPPAPGARVKVCGLTRPEDALACARAGAWAIGVVLSPVGPRHVDLARGAEVMSAVPAGVARVGVFVDATPAVVRDAAARCRLTHAQVHGEMDPCEVRRVADVAVIQAVAVDGHAARARARASLADLVLLDAAVPGRHGGTGTRFDWSLLEDEPVGRPFALAGGLTPEVVGDAVRRLRPLFVDVASGVESAPGVKDLSRVRAFIAAARDATRAPAPAGAAA